MQFGLNIPTSATRGADPVAAAVRAEELGFDFVSANDHPAGADPNFEVWTLLCFIAAATTRLKFAPRVMGVPYRNPAMVAKMAESLDRLSGGRLILGLGGGSSDEEHRAYGLGVRSPKDKTDGLGEALRIIRGLWTTERFSFEGRLYSVDEAPLEPKPEHKIPVWLGTFAPRALTLTGRLADGWIPSYGHAQPEQIGPMRERIFQAARDAGRDPREITCVYNVVVDVDGQVGETADVVAGPPELIATRLREFASLGFSAFNFVLAGADAAEQAERLATEVMPALRELPA